MAVEGFIFRSWGKWGINPRNLDKLEGTKIILSFDLWSQEFSLAYTLSSTCKIKPPVSSAVNGAWVWGARVKPSLANLEGWWTYLTVKPTGRDFNMTRLFRGTCITSSVIFSSMTRVLGWSCLLRSSDLLMKCDDDLVWQVQIFSSMIRVLSWSFMTSLDFLQRDKSVKMILCDELRSFLWLDCRYELVYQFHFFRKIRLSGWTYISSSVILSSIIRLLR